MIVIYIFCFIKLKPKPMSNIDDVIKIVNENKDYIYMDYSSKIKSIDDFEAFVYKSINPKYIKFIFKIDFREVLKNCKQSKKNQIRELIDDCYDGKMVILYNKDNFLSLRENVEIEAPLIRKFLSSSEYIEVQKCVVCMEEGENMQTCKKCYSLHCQGCLKQMLKRQLLLCGVCRYDFMEELQMKVYN